MAGMDEISDVSTSPLKESNYVQMYRVHYKQVETNLYSTIAILTVTVITY